jgi:hypothetical protein
VVVEVTAAAAGAAHHLQDLRHPLLLLVLLLP